MTQIISTDNVFDPDQQNTITLLADLMIPAKNGMPSAADAAICKPALAGLSAHADTISESLRWLEAYTQQQYSKSIAALSSPDQQSSVEHLKQEQSAFTALLQTHVIACYYRDDRVLRALNLPARAPFPEGNAVTPTDWSLLDNVRKRTPFYREA